MDKYKTIQDAKNDGWIPMSCAFPTKYQWYSKDGDQKTKEDLVEN